MKCRSSSMIESLEARCLLAFVHPGILNTQADFTRMAAKVAANAEPWLSGWNKLLSSGWAHLGMQPGPVATITRGDTNNSYIMWSQIDQCYNSAMIWKVTGDTRYADQAVNFLNAWASVNTTVNGNSNVALALGLYGFQWANVAEIMRTYSGWAAADQTKFQDYLLNVFVDGIHNYLGMPPYTQHWGSDPTHYWANWDLCNIGALMGIGVFCDRRDLYDQALNYIYNGVGNGAFDKVIYYMHPGNQGQGQEAGRDQGHASLDFALLGQICQMAWNQGDDLFSYKNNEILAGVEYLAKYALGNDVPYVSYASNTSGPWGAPETTIAGPQGLYRPIFELFYNHYVTMEGLSAPYTTQALMQHTRPEGDWGNGDEYSWGTLLFALDPDPTVHAPQDLLAYEKGTGNIQLSWWGGANDTSFNVYRATSAAGPFTQIASGILPTSTTYTDQALPAGTYYYKVTGVSGATETAATNVVQAISGNELISQLKFDETGGTTASDSVGSLTGTLNGGATFIPGKSGNAVSLNGSTGYVSLPAGSITGLADFTVATWVYLNSSQTWARIFDFGDSRGDWMFLTPRSGSGTLQFATGTTYNYNKQSVDGPAMPTNRWVHVAVTLSDRVATVYVNGVAVAGNANMDFSPSQINGGMPNSWIGRSQFSADPYLDGKVDDFRIYSGALEPAELYTLATGNPAPAVPSAPPTLNATAVPGNQINLSWTPVSGAAAGYTIKRATIDGGPYTPIATVVRGSSYSDTARVAGTTYYYVVTANNAGGESAASPQASDVALPPMPGIPANLIAKGTAATAVTLWWDPASDAASYSIKRASSSEGPYTTIATGITGTSYTDDDLISGNESFYVVSAVNASGQSAESNQASATPSDLYLRLKFDESAGSSAADSSGNADDGTLNNGPTWSTSGKIGSAIALDGVDDYISLPGGAVSALTSITIASWVNLDSISTWMRIFDFGSGTSSYMFLSPKGGSNVARFAITTSGYGAEQQINGNAALPIGVWTHVAITLSGSLGILYVNGVEVGRNSSMTLNPSLLGATTQNYLGESQFSSDPHLHGRLDDFRIYSRALSAAEVSSLSHTFSAPAAPSSLTATPGDGQVSLSWGASAGATGYIVKRSLTSGGPYSVIASGLTGTSYTDPGLNNGVTYHYVVAAANIFDSSADSDPASATPQAITASVVSATHDYLNSPNVLRFVFDSDVVGRFSVSSLSISNLTTGGAAFGPTGFSYDSATNSATFTLPVALADGTYRAILSAGGVLASDYSFDFFSLAGDANHDRFVDVTDLGILATNWQQSGKTFADGDFNYDGVVDVTDLGILATNWQKSLTVASLSSSFSLASVGSPTVSAAPASGNTTIRRTSRNSLVRGVLS